MIVNKKCMRIDNYLRPYKTFKQARTGFKKYLEALKIEKHQKVLLPAYIGWSINEGSGVFDPINELDYNYDFYRLDSKLKIDLQYLEKKLNDSNVSVFVIIHYFGFVDSNAKQAIKLAKESGALVVEDEAHSMYTDLIGGKCGRDGDISLFSLHKMLPVKTGGMLVANGEENKVFNIVEDDQEKVINPMEYDLTNIAEKRRNNAMQYINIIFENEMDIELLYDTIDKGIIPQTLPIIIRSVSRDEIYFEMNRRGYGVVSLYHTMIKQLEKENYPESFEVSRKIMNLPVHQDVKEEQIVALMKTLKEVIQKLQK